ncbi:MAG: tRNA epoxyqueuosine(34) reductase QueG [Spirochaetia bacterium]|nr:tRNA epoxyqueuosine(34) reductase QueG [Spirochaetia bacterium]
MKCVPEIQLHTTLGRHNLEHVRIIPLPQVSPRLQSDYESWIQAGFHGEMEYLKRHTYLKYQPQGLLPEARSLIQVVLPYYRSRRQEKLTPGQGRIARYAWGRDYHKVLKKRLTAVCRELAEQFPGENFRAFVDSGPLDERYYAERAGLGRQGRNGLLIHPHYGSWVFLGEILTTLVIEPARMPDPENRPSEPQLNGPGSICPTDCTNCRRKCPTGALRTDGRFDARRCISYLTIEHHGRIPVELRPLIGDWLFGCDICQDVCPLNRQAAETKETDFLQDITGEALELSAVLRIRRREEMVELYAGSPLMRLGLEQLLRNAAIVAANTGAAQLLTELQELSRHSNPMIAEHAAWALEKLRNRNC